ncbi:hypothetical protein ACA910_012726 [Epithemia clementina (nom. ined.)]
MVSLVPHLIVVAISAAFFAWLQKPGQEETKTADLLNSAFVFVKPHANTPATQELVRKKLTESGITIISEIDIDGATIDKKKLIDRHYYAIASKATILPAKDIPVPVDKFKESFGEAWEDVLKENRVVNAMDACERFGCDAQELDVAWRSAENEKKVVKFGGGFYCGLLTFKDQKLYVFNAFFMSMRSKFVGEGKSIHCYEVEWSPAKLSWASFRSNVLGPTNPAEAPEGSIRRAILADYEKLGLSAEPNKGDNGVHASASPFEGLAEKMNWLGKAVGDYSFGRAILAAGVAKKTVEEWSVDPRVTLPDGSQCSLFDALEDLDVADCLEKLKEVNKLN